MDTRFKDFQRKLRKNMPLPEVILWQHLRHKQIGVKFRRQYSIGDYILDFYAPKFKLGIEVDGETHFINKKTRQKDKKRDRVLAEQGIKVLRFLNTEIMKNLDDCLMKIWEEILWYHPFLISPSQKGIMEIGDPHLNPPPHKRGRIEEGEKTRHPLNLPLPKGHNGDRRPPP